MNDSTASASRRSDACVLLVALVLPTLVTLVYFVWLAGSAPGIRQAAYAVGKAVQFSLPLVWVLAVQRRRIRWQLPGTRGLPESLAFGVLVFAGMVLMYYLWLEPAGILRPAAVEVGKHLSRFRIDTPMKYVALGVFYSLVHSLLEEYYWRWFVFGGLRRLVSLRLAVLISSLGFMAHHVIVVGKYFGQFSPTTLLFSLLVAVGGAVWAGIYHRSDSLYGPWLSHLCVDAGLFLIGSRMVFGG